MSRTPMVYLLYIEGDGDAAYKVGYTSNMYDRLSYYPKRLKVTLLNYITGFAKDMKALEKFIHSNMDRKHTWKGKQFDGYTELYDEEPDLQMWRKKFENKDKDFSASSYNDDTDDFLL